MRSRGTPGVNTWDIRADRMHDHDGNLPAKRGALIDATARRLDGAASMSVAQNASPVRTTLASSSWSMLSQISLHA